MGRGLYLGVRQKSPDIDLMFGLDKQLLVVSCNKLLVVWIITTTKRNQPVKNLTDVTFWTRWRKENLCFLRDPLECWRKRKMETSVIFLTWSRLLLQCAAMVAKKLLVDEKITACVKGICIVLNRKTLSGSSLVKHFAFLKISKFCALSNLLGPFIRGKIRLVLNQTRTFRINGTFRLI